MNAVSDHAHHSKASAALPFAEPKRDWGAPTADPVAFLIVDRSGTERRFRPTAAAFTLGRSKAADCVLADLSVSREHARVEWTAAGWQVTDLGSTNGTFLGDDPLTDWAPTSWPENRFLLVGSVRVYREALSRATDAVVDVTDGETADDTTATAAHAFAESAGEPTHPTDPSSQMPSAAEPEPSFALTVQELRNGDVLTCRLWMHSDHADAWPYLVGYEGDGLVIEAFNRDSGLHSSEAYWTVVIGPEERPRFGRTRRLPFALDVTNRRKERQRYVGAYVLRPSVPVYALVVPALLLALIVLLALR